MLKTKTLKEVHNNFCNYEINKAKTLKIKTVRKPKESKSGIRTSGLPKEILVRQLASLF